MEKYFVKRCFFYIECGNLMVNVDQEHNLQRLLQNSTGSLLTAMKYWYRCVTIVDVERQNLYLLCVPIALTNQHAKRMCRII
jgi:hypothetical protein